MGELGKYSVVITGLSCAEAEFRQRALGIGVKADAADRILSTLPCKVKVGQPLANARAYQEAFQKAGAVVELRPDRPPAAAAATVMGFGGSGPAEAAAAPVPATQPPMSRAQAPTVMAPVDHAPANPFQPPPTSRPPQLTSLPAPADLPSIRNPLATAMIQLENEPPEQPPINSPLIPEALDIQDDGGQLELASHADMAFQHFAPPSAGAAPQVGVGSSDPEELSLDDAPMDLGLPTGGDDGLTLDAPGLSAPTAAPATSRPPRAAPEERKGKEWDVKDRSNLVKPITFGVLALILLGVGWVVGGCKAHDKMHQFELALGPKLANAMIKLQMGGEGVTYEDVEALVVEIGKEHDVHIDPNYMEIKIRPSGFTVVCPEMAEAGTACNVKGEPDGFLSFAPVDQIRLKTRAQAMARDGNSPDFIVQIRAYATTKWVIRKKSAVVEHPVLVQRAVPTP